MSGVTGTFSACALVALIAAWIFARHAASIGLVTSGRMVGFVSRSIFSFTSRVLAGSFSAVPNETGFSPSIFARIRFSSPEVSSFSRTST
ncbi:hypothetical protein [Amycolatopsis sp. NPDC051071]|uniref:hypothetical protein n=1 Tax=Amycolatopsis sp. NPDC051071 TaxID=3154637 RepID=UPI0034130203